MTRVLIVDDDMSLLKRMQELLRKEFADYEIITAASLKEAEARLRELRAVSLVIADYQLPDGTGYDFLKYCQDHLTNVPVIIITAYPDDNEVRPAVSLRKGAFEFMSKPIDYEELFERIKRALYIAEALA